MVGKKKRLTPLALIFAILSTSLFGCFSTGVVKASQTWDMQVVSSDITLGKTAIALDPSGNPHILCQFYDGVKYASWTGSKWDVQPVDLTIVGSFSISIDLAIDINGNPQAAYYDEANNCLKYAKLTNSSWNIQTVDSGGGVYCALAIDLQGNPHISYRSRDSNGPNIKYATSNGSTWSILTVEQTIGKMVPSVTATSISVDSGGAPHICYADTTKQSVKYARLKGSTWDIQTVGITDAAEQYCSMALDMSGNPHIGYRDSLNKAQKYVWWNSSAWSNRTVESTGDSGYYISLALDSEGNPHMVYWDNLSQRLRYARWNGVFWSIETIDSGKWIGGDVYESLLGSSLAVDSRGNPHVSYVNVTGTPSGVEHSSLTYAFLELNPNNPTPTGTSVPIPTVGPSSSIPQTVEPTSSPKQSSDFLGTNIPVEYGYVMVTVGTIAVIAGVGLVYLRKIRK